MEKVNYPQIKDWSKLIQRPEAPAETLEVLISEIFTAVKQKGDEALLHYNLLFDKNSSPIQAIGPEIIEASCRRIPDDLKAAIKMAAANIERFHLAQDVPSQKTETTKGVICWRESRAIERTGLYIPGGTAPLFSTVLMLGIPAKLAGCKEIVLCTPADKNGIIHPAILFAASIAGISKIFGIGGAQAIAAMAIGTSSIPKVEKIFGPGNQYVTAAKQRAQLLGIPIDIPAGPSELLVIADKSCNPEFVAADLLSQAEHGPDSQVMLISDNEEIIQQCINELDFQLEKLPRKNIARAALMNSKALVFSGMEECIAFSNAYAPEHLILAINESAKLISKITNAGSVFLGNYSCESAGDYASGTNHTLPTNGYARSYSGVSLDSFQKKISFQELSPEGIRNIGPAIELMAEAEQLWGHKNAVTLRLNSLYNV